MPLVKSHIILAAAAMIFAAVVSSAAMALQGVAPFANSSTLRQSVSHIAPYTCGVKSGSFARICRPQADVSCKNAVKRGAKGFSSGFCAARHMACTSCLAMLRRCIGFIGHGKRSEFSCDECTGKFSRCIGRRYPELKN
jgi:hypothetical protein